MLIIRVLKKNSFRVILFFIFCLLFSLSLSAQIAPDEDTGGYSTCNEEGANDTRTSHDLPNPVNVGTIDDRSCYANYKESIVYGKTWGIYNITYDSNNQDVNGLQPRIERSLSRSKETGIGSYARFTGVVRILEVGDTSGNSQDGTYIAQAKGKHTGGGGSADPAICLYLAKPVYGTGVDATNQVSFNIYAERIKYRGGEGSGREIVFLKNIGKNVETNFELEIGFREDPVDVSKKQHYCDAVIGGEAFNWNIPEPEKGIESGIRYGSYRVKGGRAQIRWASTTYQKVENVDVNNQVDLTQGVFSLKNVASGKFLTDAGLSAVPVSMSDSDVAQNTHWNFVESGSYFNIDSESFGILRAPGSGGPGGAYVVVSTNVTPPSIVSDKVWTIHYSESDETYRYESGSSGRFLYNEANGSVTHVVAPDTDDRSKWRATSKSVLNLSNSKLLNYQIKIFPNPANSKFKIVIGDMKIKNVKMFDVFGKVVYENEPNEQIVQIENNERFVPGIYLVSVLTNGDKKFFTKLVIN